MAAGVRGKDPVTAGRARDRRAAAADGGHLTDD